jgi:hypothetical protein
MNTLGSFLYRNTLKLAYTVYICATFTACTGSVQ